MQCHRTRLAVNPRELGVVAVVTALLAAVFTSLLTAPSANAVAARDRVKANGAIQFEPGYTVDFRINASNEPTGSAATGRIDAEFHLLSGETTRTFVDVNCMVTVANRSVVGGTVTKLATDGTTVYSHVTVVVIDNGESGDMAAPRLWLGFAPTFDVCAFEVSELAGLSGDRPVLTHGRVEVADSH
jgi:hypothetical protein